MIITIFILLVIIGFLIYKLTQKQHLDKQEIDSFNELKNEAQQNYIEVSAQLVTAKTSLQEIENKYQQLNERYAAESNQITNYFSNLQAQQEQQIEKIQKDKELAAKLKLEKLLREYDEEAKSAQLATDEFIQYCKEKQQIIEQQTQEQENRYNALLNPLIQYEKDKQERLFYTIQVPEEYHNDINFLLTTVAEKVQHPDIINKLIWSEYIKPYMDETIKRVGIEDKAGIYKITNLENGKSYVGKSTNVKKRLQDHFKSSVGIKTIADQAVHHEILKTGIWNWSIEVIIYCDKEQLNELEKYYIDFFHSNTFGYNKTSGGEG